ncbi:MAG: hypothetical protein DMG57_00265 [Acidobacteria bacterium]|nr:MAG: hypothetical protein DMG57_00265 [Acidobacteriota bacterium]
MFRRFTLRAGLCSTTRLLLLWALSTFPATSQIQEPAQDVPSLAVAPARRLPGAAPPNRLLWQDTPPAHVLRAVTAEEILELSRPPHHTRMGATRQLPPDLLRQGVWFTDAQGRRTWALRVTATDARGLRLHFENFDVGAGQVWTFAPGGGPKQVVGPFSSKGPAQHGAFWTVLLAGDTIEIDYQPAPDSAVGIPFTISEVFHMWAEPGAIANATSRLLMNSSPLNSAGSVGTLDNACFVDETCMDAQVDTHAASKATVFLLLENNACSGVLLNDRNSTGTPFLLTAGHCVATNHDAQFLLAIFTYKTSSCFNYTTSSASYPPSFWDPKQQASGGILLAQNVHLSGQDNIYLDKPDFAFVKLDERPDWPFTMAGWSRDAAFGQQVISVSHAQALPQVVARGSIQAIPANDFFQTFWTQGNTDQGSSGAGVFDANGSVVGVVSNGPYGPNSACQANVKIVNFTRFSSIYGAVQGWLEDTVKLPIAPSFTVSGITNAASYVGGLVPGSLATLFGTNLTTSAGIVTARSFPLPTELAGVHVEVNGLPAPLLAVANVNGTEQINFQVPWKGPGTASVTVTNGNGGVSARSDVPLFGWQPGIFTDSHGYGAILHGLDNRPVTPTDPAAPSEIVALFTTGLGAVDSDQIAGVPAGSKPPARTVQGVPQVTIGGVAAEVRFSGLAPGFAGLYQVNVVVPQGSPAGDLPVVVIQFDVASNTAKLPVR